MEEIAPLQRGFDLPNQNIVEGDIPIVYSNGILKFHNQSKSKGPGLVTGRSGTIGKFTFIESSEYWPHNTSLWVTSFYGNAPKFIYYLYHTINIQQFSTGSGVPTLNRNDVHSKVCSIPPIAEQQKIALFLTRIDERIQTQNKIIRELNVLKTTVTNRIFSGQLRFKDDQGKDFPSWECNTLREIGEFSGGGTPSSSNADFWNGDIPWVSSSDLSENNIHSINITRFITENAINNSATKLCAAPLILIVSRVGVGKVAYSEEALCTSQDFLNIHNFSCNGLFLTYLLSIEMKKAASNTQGTSIKGISSAEIKSKQVWLPCIAEQTKIINFLSSIDSKINIEIQLLQKLEEQKKFLLQQMFV